MLGYSISCGPSVARDTVGDHELVIEQTSAVILPDSLQITGGVSVPEGTILWSRRQAILVVVSDAGSVRVRSLKGVHPIAVAVSADTLELVDAARPAIVRLVSGRETYDTIAFSRHIRPFSAVRRMGRWYLAATDTVSGTMVLVLDVSHTRARVVCKLPMSHGERRLEVPVHLSLIDETLVVAEARKPFRILRVLPGCGSAVSAGPAFSALAGLETNVDDWISLPLIALDTGSLQTFVNRTDDERLLVRYDDAGKQANTLTIKAAIGFVASDRRRRLLKAVRRSDVLELVTYRWSWITHNRQ